MEEASSTLAPTMHMGDQARALGFQFWPPQPGHWSHLGSEPMDEDLSLCISFSHCSPFKKM